MSKNRHNDLKINKGANCTRYNLSFMTPKEPKNINRQIKLVTSFSHSKTHTRTSFEESPKSQTKINKSYTKYSYFPASYKRLQSCANA